ncbi:hypothetical protein GUJ93_ZPchr0011g28294 [Zizania palustris]|uniref:Uncharacterized protein n=1 Tax=Zizania palustris TaxID=103762 RepID=A0A8J5WDR7_ZIZPA|nr:hypothetical protein GUJ93_ZPchr0011g28294 [Zizania palustris]
MVLRVRRKRWGFGGCEGAREAQSCCGGLRGFGELKGCEGARGRNGATGGFGDLGGCWGLRRGDCGCGECFETNEGFRGVSNFTCYWF